MWQVEGSCIIPSRLVLLNTLDMTDSEVVEIWFMPDLQQLWAMLFRRPLTLKQSHRFFMAPGLTLLYSSRPWCCTKCLYVPPIFLCHGQWHIVYRARSLPKIMTFFFFLQSWQPCLFIAQTIWAISKIVCFSCIVVLAIRTLTCSYYMFLSVVFCSSPAKSYRWKRKALSIFKARS